MTVKSPEELDHFITVVRRELDECRLPEAARQLATVQETAFTTSSEWLGELGAAVSQIRKEAKIPPKLDDNLEIIGHLSDGPGVTVRRADLNRSPSGEPAPPAPHSLLGYN